MRLHPIDAYIQRHAMTRSELARQCELSPGFLRDVVIGRRQLGRASVLRLVAVSGGELTLGDLLLPKSYSPEENA